jgi:uncharacterized protein YecE (DUF72 family)
MEYANEAMGRRADRHFGLALQALARDVLSRGPGQADELSYASSILGSIEINGTFYSLQRPEYFAAWAAQTPAGFVFAVKARATSPISAG